MARRTFLAVLICLAGLGVVLSSPRAMAQDSTPVAGSDLPGRTADGAKTPLYLLNQLLTSSFDTALLPEDFDDPVVSLWEYGDDDLIGAIGGVIVGLNGNDIASINYIVYPSNMEAEAGVLSTRPSDALDVPMATPVPTNRMVFSLSDYVVCAQLSNETAVIAGHIVAADQNTGAVGPIACDLLDAGLAHLDALRSMP